MLTKEDLHRRNNISVHGAGKTTLMLAHGFGCDQTMWHRLLPLLETHYTVILFDYVGSGGSAIEAFDTQRYASLGGYAQDVVEICQILDLNHVHFVGHSVSAMIGLLASLEDPSRFASQVMVCPSPYFLNDPPGYNGGFERSDLEELLDLMSRNQIGWAHYFAPLVAGAGNADDTMAHLRDSFCSTDPVVARTFAEATFFSDCRDALRQAPNPVLILQSANDTLAAIEVGQYTHDEIPESMLRVLPTEGHCIHMTHPDEVNAEIRAWLNSLSGQ